jgi:hypothetical protein
MTMVTSQWVGLALLLPIIGGIALTFVRHGAKVKPDNNSDNWARHTGGDGAGPPP